MSNDTIMLELATALGDIVAHFDASAEDSVQSRLLEVSTALAEIGQALDARDKPLDLSPLVAAVKTLRLTVTSPVTVSPTPINFTPPPAQIVVEKPRVKSIKVNTDWQGRIESLDLIYTESKKE